MNDTPSLRRPSHHDGMCECEELAQTMGVDPSTITFDFCLHVLQRHWRMTCRHGATNEEPHQSIATKWTGAGPTDPVKAILISNAPEDTL